MLLHWSHHYFISVVDNTQLIWLWRLERRKRSLWGQRGEDVIWKIKGKHILRKEWMLFCQDTDQTGWRKYKTRKNLAFWKNKQRGFLLLFCNFLFLYFISKAPLLILSSGLGKLAEKICILVLYYKNKLPSHEIPYSQWNFFLSSCFPRHLWDGYQ